ncbi:MAG: SPFH domain-containing protein [Legionellales bacterium]
MFRQAMVLGTRSSGRLVQMGWESPSLPTRLTVMGRALPSQTRSISSKVNKDGNIVPIFRVTVLNPIRFLPQQYTVFSEIFGKYTGIYNPGLNFCVPLIQELIFVINTENVFAVTHQEAITSDNASVSANAVFYYTIVGGEKAVYKNSDLLRSLENLVVTNLRATMGNMTLDEVLRGRAEMNAQLKLTVEPAAKEWGVIVNRIEIKEITPEKKLVTAMDQQMIAERDRRATETTAEGKRRATVLAAQAERERIEQEAQGCKAAKIYDAEAQLEVATREAEARRRLADADAYVREATAKAEAAAIKGVAQALEHSPETAQYLTAQKAVSAWGDMARSPNYKVMFFPSGSSLATPMALASELLGHDKHPGGSAAAPASPPAAPAMKN